MQVSLKILFQIELDNIIRVSGTCGYAAVSGIFQNLDFCQNKIKNKAGLVLE